MTDLCVLKLDENATFEHLPRAPIVEAVIEMRARADPAWQETDVAARLKESLPDYPTVKSIHSWSMTAQFAFAPPGIAKPPSQPPEQADHGWIGFRHESSDGRRIAVFSRDSFSLSRLPPYEGWTRFVAEALRLWQLHLAIARPSEIQRLGVRFINRFEVPIDKGGIETYFSGLPAPVLPLPTVGFIHQHSVAVPNRPFGVTLTRMLEPPPETARTVALVVDIDVLSPGPLPVDAGKITERLSVMRTLKNVAFFGSLTKDALDLFR